MIIISHDDERLTMTVVDEIFGNLFFFDLEFLLITVCVIVCVCVPDINDRLWPFFFTFVE